MSKEEKKTAPMIIWGSRNTNNEQDCSSDCACPVDTFYDQSSADIFTVSPSLPAIDEWRISPTIYRAAIDDQYELVFDPQGRSPMAVLNRPAAHALDHFLSPDPKARFAASKYDGADLDAIWAFVNAGFIQPAANSPTQPDFPPPQTLTAWLHVTNACNLRCDYCYITKSSESMSIQDGRLAIDAIFRSAGFSHFQHVKIKYAGGEPTLNMPLILLLNRYAQETAQKMGIGFEGVILSNGVHIKEQTIEDIRASGLKIAISLDGIGEAHDRQRKFANGRGSFDLVERSLNDLTAKGIRPTIMITISKRNLDGLPDVLQFVLQRNLPFTQNFFRENNCTGSDSDLQMSNEELIDGLQKCFRVIENHLPDFSLLGILMDRARLDIPHQHTCGAGKSYLVIDQHGRVAKCHMEITQPVTDVSSLDILGDLSKEPSGIQNLSVDDKPDCANCAWRYVCAGGCPLITFRSTGRYDARSPYCDVYRTIFPEVLRLEGLRLLNHYHR